MQTAMHAIFVMDQGSAPKTATDRAAEAIEAAEKMFADEMGVTLDLCPAAKVALTGLRCLAALSLVKEIPAPSVAFVWPPHHTWNGRSQTLL
jgi:hypothetical protein